MAQALPLKNKKSPKLLSELPHYYYNHFMDLWILSRTTQVSWHQKGKTNMDILEQETVSASGISWAICKSAAHPRHNHTSIPPLSFYRLDALPSTLPTASKH